VGTNVFTPICAYRTTLAQDDVGHDVGALQLALNAWGKTQAGLGEALVEDGQFGGRTHRRVRTFQRRNGLYVDGIAGPVSQRRLAILLLEPHADNYNLPHGLLRGQVELESAYFVGAVNCLVPGARDIGWTQRRVPDGSPEELYKAAFSASAFGTSAELLRRRKDRYYADAARAIKDHEFMWKAAAGSHNWPAAGAQVAAGGFETWRYTADGKTYGIDDVAPWIQRIGVPGVETGRQWWNFYTERATAYVSTWTP
jgi:peptidoglycan hydrolase-like protein with peptidoglycan-binding domain